MPKPKQRTIHVPFPTSGENRRRNYRAPETLAASSRAVNVRSVGPLEKRGRGGSRPGLSKFIDTDFGTNITGISSVTYIDADGDRQQDLAVTADGALYIVQGGVATEAVSNLSIDGDNITIDGDNIVMHSTVTSTNPLVDGNTFQMAEWNGKLYIADATLQKYDPLTGTVSTVEDAPASMPLVCVYQERLVLSGVDHLFYMSGQADGTNWDAGAEMGDVGRSVMGAVGDAGVVGEKILAMHNHRDVALIFGCQDSVWAVYGNIADTGGGRKQCVSPFSGIIAPGAMAVTPNGMVLFLTRAGLYAWQVGSKSDPEPFSPGVIPDELLDVDTATTDVLMRYDHRCRGVHLFLTPLTGIGSHWWIDLENRAFWPVKLNDDHQPHSTAVVSRSGFSNVLLGCGDGYIRVFDDDATDDDGSDLNSHLVLGPFHIAGADGYDGLLNEIISALADDSGDLQYTIYTGETAEDAVDAADTALAAAVASEYA